MTNRIIALLAFIILLFSMISCKEKAEELEDANMEYYYRRDNELYSDEHKLPYRTYRLGYIVSENSKVKRAQNKTAYSHAFGQQFAPHLDNSTYYTWTAIRTTFGHCAQHIWTVIRSTLGHYAAEAPGCEQPNYLKISHIQQVGKHQTRQCPLFSQIKK